MVQQRLRAVFANLFQVDPARLSPTATPDEIDGWDSFGHLALVEALQGESRVEFEIEDIAQMDNLEAIESILRLRGPGRRELCGPAARGQGRRPARVDHLDAEHSYRELSAAVSRGDVPGGLRRRPRRVRRRRRRELDVLVAAYLGAMQAGASPFPSRRPHAHRLPRHRGADPDALRFRGSACAGLREMAAERRHVVLDDAGPASFGAASIWTLDELCWSGTRTPARGGGGDTAALLFSSGSTGKPRGWCSRTALHRQHRVHRPGDRLGEGDRAMAVLPFHYSFGASCCKRTWPAAARW